MERTKELHLVVEEYKAANRRGDHWAELQGRMQAANLNPNDAGHQRAYQVALQAYCNAEAKRLGKTGFQIFWDREEGILIRHETAMRRAEQEQHRQLELHQMGVSQGIMDYQRGFNALDAGIDEYFTDFGDIHV